MTGESAINTVMSAFLGTAISLYAASPATASRVGSWLYACLFIVLLGAIVAGVSINNIANCWYNIRVSNTNNLRRSNHQVRLAKNFGVFAIILILFLIFSGPKFQEYSANLFDTFGFVILFSLVIWLLSLGTLNHLHARSSISTDLIAQEIG
jgi:hypothetical protein